MRIVFGAAVIALATAACGDRGATLELGSEARDSAGVSIVESARPPDGSRLGWRVDSVPSVSIGALEGEEPYLLDQVRDALTMPDGRIVVANRSSQELRIFDASGIHVDTWGGRGEGPGEFNSLLEVAHWPGDSLIAWYSQSDRLSVFDSSGNFGRTLIPGDLRAHVALPTGAILASGFSAGGFSLDDGRDRRQRNHEVVDADGQVLASLGPFPGSEMHTSGSGNVFSIMTIPFTRSTRTTAWAGLFVVAPNDTYEIRAFEPAGALSRIVRRDHALVAPTPTHTDAEIERRVALRPPEQQAERRQELRRTFEEVPIAETFPAFDQIVADALGHLWVEEYDLPGEPRTNPLWTVFDPEGRALGFVETPAGMNVYEIGADYILGRVTDDLGVEYVQVWSLMRSGG
ncbi:MAG: 6-bladed beta-propeller [Gemmatimonadetes bacterium]|nr:6-bladed beta-propeller [Gemmatimonadota bacterium]